MMDPETFDCTQRHTTPAEHSDRAAREFEQQVASDTIAWVIGNRRPGIFSPRSFPGGSGESLLLAPLTTGPHTLGIVLVYVRDKEESIPAGKLALLSLLTKLYSFSLENLGLHGKMQAINEHLESEMDQRSKDLALAHKRLTFNHEQLKQAYQGLQKLDKAKDNFISLTSHELRTPLTSIICCAEILRDGMFDGEAQMNEFLGTILSEGMRLLALVNDILDLSKIESGKLSYGMVRLNIEIPMDQSLETIRSKANEKQIALVTDYQSAGEQVLGDPERLMQVMANLLSNAVKFTPAGGTITLRTMVEGDKLRIEVADTGIGLAREDLAKVFSKFEQVEKTEYHSEGTGLGMPISKAIVEAHHGTLWVESRPTEGSTFIFTLPRQAKGRP